MLEEEGSVTALRVLELSKVCLIPCVIAQGNRWGPSGVLGGRG